MTEYDAKSATYASLAEKDPVKQYVQYPNALRLLGDISGKKVLDIGCGDGIFTRMLARQGARVVGYDPSTKIIELAHEHETREPLGIEYEASQRLPQKWVGTCDVVVSVMVLLYAQSTDELQALFADARQALKKGGSFCSVTYNPAFQRLEQNVFNRRFEKIDDHRLRVHFLTPDGKERMTATATYFTAAEYEQAARAAGFTDFSWQPIAPTKEGQVAMGETFWNGFTQDSPYIGCIASVPTS